MNFHFYSKFVPSRIQLVDCLNSGIYIHRILAGLTDITYVVTAVIVYKLNLHQPTTNIVMVIHYYCDSTIFIITQP